MKLGGLGIVCLVALVGCPKSGPRNHKHDCEDVSDHAMKLHARVTPPVDERVAKIDALNRNAECLESWTQAVIDCYATAQTIDRANACVPATATAAGGEPRRAADPACVAAADNGAAILATDAGAPGDVDLVARAREAILQPCLESRYSEGLLECLSDTELKSSFGICGFGMSGQPDWEALKASLGAAGFSPKQ